MQVETLKDVLHWTSRFHENLSEVLQLSSVETTNTRIQLLLGYLAEHEHKLAQVLEQFELTGNKNALDTWCYEYLDKTPIIQQKIGPHIFDDIDEDQIMLSVTTQHQQVIELYRYLLGRADIEPAKELLESLVSLEEHEAMVMSQAANRLHDI
ncbi:MAG: ATPase [Porticoccaceae bacterium]